jgi:glycosyltransferase involved in cell wall biosynthesis
MKILHVCESLIGGPASYLEEILPFQAQRLSAKNVVLIVPDDHRAHVAASIDCVVETYIRTGRNPRSLLALALAIRGAIKRHDPDVVHLHSSFAGAIGRFVLSGLRSRARVVYCAHCWSFDRPERSMTTRLWTSVERALSHLTDVIVNISPHELPLLRRARFPLKKTELIITGLSDLAPERRTPPRAKRAPGSPLRLLFAGRMDRQKGIDLLLREFADIDPKRATLTLVGNNVVGRTDLVLLPHVESIGWVARDVLSMALQDVDAVIMPSRWEGMPLWAIEVMRSGRVLVCSSHGAFPHFIEHGRNGFLIDIDRPGFLDRALCDLETSDLPVVGRAARTTYETMFGNEPMNADLLSLYDRLADRDRQSVQPEGAAGIALPRPSHSEG